MNPELINRIVTAQKHGWRVSWVTPGTDIKYGCVLMAKSFYSPRHRNPPQMFVFFDGDVAGPITSPSTMARVDQNTAKSRQATLLRLLAVNATAAAQEERDDRFGADGDACGAPSPCFHEMAEIEQVA